MNINLIANYNTLRFISFFDVIQCALHFTISTSCFIYSKRNPRHNQLLRVGNDIPRGLFNVRYMYN